MEVRVVREHEVDEAGDVVLAAYRGIEGAPALSHGYGDELRAVGARTKGAVVLVAVGEGSIVGCVTLVVDVASPWAEDLRAGEAGIRMLGVAPSGQRQGVGRRLVDACVAEARARGKRAVFLHSTPWMPAAHRLYESMGFDRVPERDALPVPDVPLLAFRLDIGAGGDGAGPGHQEDGR